MPKRRVKIPATLMKDRVPAVKDFKAKSEDTIIIVEAFNEMARQCDDAYSPAIEDVQEDIDTIVRQQSRTLSIVKKLSTSLKEYRTVVDCECFCKQVINSITLMRVIITYAKQNPWAFAVLTAVFILFLPWLHNLSEIFLVGAFKKLFAIDLRVLLPSLFGGSH